MSGRALIVGASGGIGAALLAAWPGEALGLSRAADGLDVTDEAAVAAALGRLEPPFDLVAVATGALGTPERQIAQVTAEALLAQYAVNAVGPMLVLKHARRLLPRDGRSVFAALSARVGSIGDNRLGGWHGYRAAKAGLNQLVHGAAVEMRRTHPDAILACLHPGTVATPFTAGYAGHRKDTPGTAAANLLAVIAALTPAQSGGFFDQSGAEIPW